MPYWGGGSYTKRSAGRPTLHSGFPQSEINRTPHEQWAVFFFMRSSFNWGRRMQFSIIRLSDDDDDERVLQQAYTHGTVTTPHAQPLWVKSKSTTLSWPNHELMSRKSRHRTRLSQRSRRFRRWLIGLWTLRQPVSEKSSCFNHHLTARGVRFFLCHMFQPEAQGAIQLAAGENNPLKFLSRKARVCLDCHSSFSFWLRATKISRFLVLFFRHLGRNLVGNWEPCAWGFDGNSHGR